MRKKFTKICKCWTKTPWRWSKLVNINSMIETTNSGINTLESKEARDNKEVSSRRRGEVYLLSIRKKLLCSSSKRNPTSSWTSLRWRGRVLCVWMSRYQVGFLPCAHQVLCEDCDVLYQKKGMDECSSCRTPIKKQTSVRFADS
ncbi:hypothetical protein H5410_048021 [Solanum commersonii]|uniref:RING-type domain-containing protein n=1 Tax=Solanum commersonii TaxID=4109 RepID=A0A9J5XGW1_SOLCO|nr:hypothetical protein H5410_048021 [Solanum commersonii]